MTKITTEIKTPVVTFGACPDGAVVEVAKLGLVVFKHTPVNADTGVFNATQPDGDRYDISANSPVRIISLPEGATLPAAKVRKVRADQAIRGKPYIYNNGVVSVGDIRPSGSTEFTPLFSFPWLGCGDTLLTPIATLHIVATPEVDNA